MLACLYGKSRYSRDCSLERYEDETMGNVLTCLKSNSCLTCASGIVCTTRPSEVKSIDIQALLSTTGQECLNCRRRGFLIYIWTYLARYLLTVVDRYIRWIEAVPLTDILARTAAEAFFLEWLSRVPATVITDQGICDR